MGNEKKIYVLDTNILLESPKAIFGFEDNIVMITGTTLQELDTKKTAPGELGFHARETARIIEELRNKGNIIHGIKLDNNGEFRVTPDLAHELPLGYSLDKPDNRIISSVLCLADDYKDQYKVVLVTNDSLMRLNAVVCGVKHVEFYKNDHVSEEKAYLGHRTYLTSPGQIDALYEKGTLPVEDILNDKAQNDFVENEFLVLTDNLSKTDGTSAKSALAIYRNGTVKLIQKKQIHPMNVTPKNVSQTFALYALLAPVEEIPFVILNGPAGCAKTFLSLAAGLDETYERSYKKSKSTYNRIYISRNNVMSDDDFGYLPGDLEEKMNPLMAPFFDNLESLLDHKNEEDPEEIKKQIDDLFYSGIINVCPMAYMRGRSITHTFLIVDEAQNATRTQIRDVITRAGEGTKIVICGDPAQIDKHTLDKWNNGLVYAASKMKGSPLCAQITFSPTDCVRSALAKEAIDRLN